ncbi:MAG TPA: pitrilysin family protein [Gemmatimonadaceae bacterium]|nr:pitrilysin family protein [Gemmatimonadaceae bacterium]
MTWLAVMLAASTGQAQTFDRTKPPVLGPPPSLTVPPTTERTLPNGLRLIVIEQHELPLVDIQLVVKTGGEADPKNKTGTASLTATLLTEGTATRTSQAIAEQQAFLGVSVFASSGWDRASVSLHAPVAVLDSALALFADVALHPAFPQTEFDRQRKLRMTQLLQLKDRGPSMADRAFVAILYGDDHPYGRPLAGIETTVESLTRDDLASFYKTYYRPNNSFIVVAGDVTVADIERRVNAAFGGWEKAAVPAVQFPAPPVRSDRRIYVVDKPGAPQSSFRIGSVGVARSTGDYYPLRVMNTILGEPFTSRLNQNLRENKNFTYGAGSSFSMRREPGPFMASAEIRDTVTGAALVEFMKELENIRKPVPADELAKAKKYLQLGLPADFETTGQIAGQMATYALFGLPLNEPSQAVAKIGAVSTADVTRVANKYLDPSKMAIVIAGDAKRIVPLLKATGIGPVEMRDSYGKPVIVP